LPAEVATLGRELLLVGQPETPARALAARRFGAFCAHHQVPVDDAVALVAAHVRSLRRRDRAGWSDVRIAVAVGSGWAQDRLDEPATVSADDLRDVPWSA
jgi:hypothetical protein